MELPMMSTNSTIRTDTEIEETAGSRQSSMTESMIEIVSSEIAARVQSEMNGAKTNGKSKEAENITEIFPEIISEKTTPIK